MCRKNEAKFQLRQTHEKITLFFKQDMMPKMHKYVLLIALLTLKKIILDC